MAEQRLRLGRWESVAECERRDDTSASPALCFGDFVEAKARLKMRKMPGLGEPPAEILGSSRMVAGSKAYSLFNKRSAGEKGHTERIWLVRLAAPCHPKPRTDFEELAQWPALCLCCTLLKLYDRLL